MVFEQEYGTAILVDDSIIPETQTKTQRQKVHKTRTRNYAEDSTVVSICFQDRRLDGNVTGPRIQGVVAYIRPTSEEEIRLEELSGGLKIINYLFRNKTVEDLKEKVINSGHIPLRIEKPTKNSYLCLFTENNNTQIIYDHIKGKLEDTKIK